MPFEPATGTNRLLAALPQRERRRFLDGCRPIELVVSEVLVDAGERIRYVYFPIDGFVSQATPAESGPQLDVGMIGDEGMVGVSLVLGVGVSAFHSVVQGGGPALRMDAALFRHQVSANPALLHRLKLYVHVLMAQLAQTAACTRYHLVEGRLARLLLMTQDRARTQKVRVTHEVLAGKLGVRRAGVSIAATSLQHRELISYRRGDITILDRGGLKAAACSCYAIDNVIYARLMASGSRRYRGVG